MYIIIFLFFNDLVCYFLCLRILASPQAGQTGGTTRSRLLLLGGRRLAVPHPPVLLVVRSVRGHGDPGRRGLH